MSDRIFFYGHTNGPYRCFSNFYQPVKFTYNGMDWNCSEQAFMYYKSLDPTYQKSIRRSSDPYHIKRLGRNVVLRPHWDTIKYPIMCDVVLAKFSQNDELKEILLSTGDKPIHEDCKDEWWGGGPNFPAGRDWLGKALVLARQTLILEEITTTPAAY